MEDLYGIQTRRQGVAENIQKALGAGYEPEGTDENTNIQKGRVGVYEDNAKNRRLNRVGQQYGKKKEEEQPKSKTSSNKEENRKRTNRIAELNSKLYSESGLTDEEYSEYKKLTQKQSDVSSHAAKASDGALKRAAADEKASEDVRNAAKEELKKRGGGSEDENDKGSENKKITINDINFEELEEMSNASFVKTFSKQVNDFMKKLDDETISKIGYLKRSDGTSTKIPVNHQYIDGSDETINVEFSKNNGKYSYAILFERNTVDENGFSEGSGGHVLIFEDNKKFSTPEEAVNALQKKISGVKNGKKIEFEHW